MDADNDTLFRMVASQFELMQKHMDERFATVDARFELIGSTNLQNPWTFSSASIADAPASDFRVLTER
jgi:hypothetical protein